MRKRSSQELMDEFDDLENVVGTFPRGFSQRTGFTYPLVRADRLVTLNYGKGLVEKSRVSGNVPVYGTNGQCGWHNEGLVKGPGVILGRKGMGPLGVEWCESDFWVIDTAYYVTPNTPELDLKFFYYLTKYIGLNHLKDGTSNPSLSRDTFSAQLLPFPPLDEQKAIAHILVTLDNKIELNQQMNHTLESFARTLFKSWFIDFDPVRAKMDGRQPAGMDAETAALFPDEFEDSAIGQIPKGWKVGSLEQVVNVNSRSITKNYPHQVIEYVDISSVTIGRLEGTTIYALSEAPSRAKRLVRHGDTIWSGVRPNRKSYLFIHTPPQNLVVSTGFIVLSPEAIPPSYLYAWVTTDDFVDYLAFNADGSAYPAVRPDRFSDAQILIPLKPILNKFEEQASSIRDKIIQNERESIVLASIRDALLPKLLSGEIRISLTLDLPSEVEPAYA